MVAQKPPYAQVGHGVGSATDAGQRQHMRDKRFLEATLAAQSWLQDAISADGLRLWPTKASQQKVFRNWLAGIALESGFGERLCWACQGAEVLLYLLSCCQCIWVR